MDRRASWFPLVAVVLVVVGLVALATPPPAHAFDPQLALALASAAGAIALIVGYLIVANGREKDRAASLEGIYTCSEQQAAGPMGCGGPAATGRASADVPAAAPDRPMAGEGYAALRTDPPGTPAQVCPAGQTAGPMGCGSPEPVYAAAAASAVPAIIIQGQ